MILAIDASNIRSGGGLTHLKEILSNGDPTKYGIEKVFLWSSENTLKQIVERDWLVKKTHPWLNRSNIFSFAFQILFLSIFIKKEKCNLILVPGGTFLGSFKDIVSMSQNMLPFEKKELERFPRRLDRLKFKLLYLTQSFTFKKSKGIIFLTNYALNTVKSSVNITSRNMIIPHGINLSFLQNPRACHSIDEFSDLIPFELLYVSIVTVYKHQWNVAEAVLRLRNEGYPIKLRLIGGSTSESLDKLNSVIERDKHHCIVYEGLVPYEKLSSYYKNANGFIFASTCENQPIILLEAMSAGLPILCSNFGPMPEVLVDGGIYFNPTDVDDIYRAIKSFLEDRERRTKISEESYRKSSNYTWKDCAEETFKFLSKFS